MTPPRQNPSLPVSQGTLSLISSVQALPGSGNAGPMNSATSDPTGASTGTSNYKTPSYWKDGSQNELTIGVILAVTIIASLVLCLLLRHLHRRCLLPLSSQHSSSVSATTDNAVPIFSSRRISPQETLIYSLPSFTFSSITRKTSSSISGDCAVCLSKFEKDDRLRLLPLCCHAFHADCVDVWLSSNLTCPLCRSSIFTIDADFMKSLQSTDHAGNSFRVEMGSISRRGTVTEPHVSASGDLEGRSDRFSSYSIGSFEYHVEEVSEIAWNPAHRHTMSANKEEDLTQTSQETFDVGMSGGRSWLKDSVDRLSASFSSLPMSLRSSGRFFAGSSRRSEISGVPELDLEESGVGEEIIEWFRWLSGV